jgi:hypothetical protein
MMRMCFRAASTACAVGVVFVSTFAKDATSYRMLIYGFRRGPDIVTVVISDPKSGPVCSVAVSPLPTVEMAPGAAAALRPTVTPGFKQGSVKLFRPQFDKLWSAFSVSGADNYSSPRGTPQNRDIDRFYTFDTAQTAYAIPRNKATPALRFVVTQLENYAKDLIKSGRLVRSQ